MAEHASRTVPSSVPVLVVGAGPIGLVTAIYFARNGIRCVLVERNLQTTKWPKMDLTNCRSMELLNRLQLIDGLRSKGVPQHWSMDVLISSGLGEGGELLVKWNLLSTNEWTKRIATQNDGKMPRHAYQRCSQAIFEAWLRPIVEAEPLIDSYWGMKFDNLTENDKNVKSTVVDVLTGEKHVIESEFVIGADGAGSRVRRSLGIKLIGGPLPGAMHLVHFKSRELETLHKQGRFWHLFNTNGSWVISQDEVETFTAHLRVPADTDPETLDPYKTLFTVLGGSGKALPIKVDEIIVSSTWRPNLACAETYSTEHKRVFLAGDAAHQNVPIGGYGMNSGIADAFDIGWKVVATLKGYGGPLLLDSYEIERRPVAVRNVEMSGKLCAFHSDYWGWVDDIGGDDVLISNTDVGRNLREKIRTIMTENDGENQLQGVEMAYRYNGSPIVIGEDPTKEPEWHDRYYVPTTWPGGRPPHIFLSDGKTSIFDFFGEGFTIVDFTSDGAISVSFEEPAAKLGIPLKRVHLPNEPYARQLWERDLVLLRPDDHVAWRSTDEYSPQDIDAEHILLIAVGKESSLNTTRIVDQDLPNGTFTGSCGSVVRDMEKLRLAAEFQK